MKSPALLGMFAPLALLVLSGCISAPPPDPIVPAQARSNLGKIAVVLAGTTPEFSVVVPLEKRYPVLDELRRGPGTWPDVDPRSGPLLTALLPMTTPLGGYLQPMQSVSMDDLNHAVDRITNAVAGLRFPELLRNTIMARARTATGQEISGGRETMPFERGYDSDALLKANAEGSTLVLTPLRSYREIAGAGIDTLLVLRVVEQGLYGNNAINPPLTLNVTVNAALMRVSDGTILESWYATHAGGKQKFTRWSEHNAARVDAGMKQAADVIADRIVARVFGVPAPAVPR